MGQSAIRYWRPLYAVLLLAAVVPHAASGQGIVGGPAAYAAGFRELATPGARTFPGLMHAIVRSDDRAAVAALADTMVAVALDLARGFDGPDDAERRATFLAVVTALEVAGGVSVSRGSPLEGAGPRLIRIAVEMPLTRRDPLTRSIPLSRLALLPDAVRWRVQLATMARDAYPVSAAAVTALWSTFGEDGRRLVITMYRNGSIADATTRSWTEFVTGGAVRDSHGGHPE